MTLGVIDECRKLGLGSLMINKTIECSRKYYPHCEFIYLHVVDYNESAIKFYKEKNAFSYFKVEKEHYEIFSIVYDAVVLYKIIERPVFTDGG